MLNVAMMDILVGDELPALLPGGWEEEQPGVSLETSPNALSHMDASGGSLPLVRFASSTSLSKAFPITRAI